MLEQLSAVVERETEYNKRPDTFEQKDFPLHVLQCDFNIWLKQLPVVGFNSSRYDLNLIQEYLIPILYASNKKLSPIKKANSFLSLATKELVFLDF